ncbi:MAG: DUF58 domain-containing protein [Nocardioidaceae bacterium]|nr:DUF58 domain-containing protein [Nocardioidaceae bacterium]
MTYLQKIRTRLTIHAHRKVLGLLEGEYAAVQIGRGMDFNDLREYVRGDDVKDIDWKASARGRQLLVKRYVAERKHTVLLCVSTGRSMAALNQVGTRSPVSKRDLSVFVAGLIGYLAVRHGDLVSLVYGDADQQHIRPRESTELHLERLLSTIHAATTERSGPADLVALLHYTARVVRRRTILAIVSDEVSVSDELADVLRRLAAQHEILFVTIGDADPTAAADSLTDRPLYDIDAGTPIPGWLRGDRRLRREYAALVGSEEAGLRRRLDQLGIVHERVRDTDAAITAVFRLLERHRHARRR